MILKEKTTFEYWTETQKVLSTFNEIQLNPKIPINKSVLRSLSLEIELATVTILQK